MDQLMGERPEHVQVAGGRAEHDPHLVVLGYLGVGRAGAVSTHAEPELDGHLPVDRLELFPGAGKHRQEGAAGVAREPGMVIHDQGQHQAFLMMLRESVNFWASSRTSHMGSSTSSADRLTPESMLESQRWCPSMIR